MPNKPVLSDILERGVAHARAVLENAIRKLPSMLFVKDVTTLEYLLWNDAAESATGWTREEVLGHTDAHLFANGTDYIQRDEAALRSNGTTTFESRFTRKDGSERSFRTHRVLIPGADGRPRFILGLSEDLTEGRAAQDRMAFLAGHDRLTHLANRNRFVDHLTQVMKARRGAAVLAIDIDDFKAINQLAGRTIGDSVLLDVATMFRLALRNGDTAARFDSDRFFLLVEGANVVGRAERYARSLLAAIEKRNSAHQEPMFSARIGLAIAGTEGAGNGGADGLIASAEMALTGARQKRGSRIAHFDHQLEEAARCRRRIEKRLADALAQDLIKIHFQPIACLATGRITTLETMARWTDTELGSVSPEVFVPVAEASGLIEGLGRRVLEKAASEAATWDPPLTVAVNLSPGQLSESLCSEVARVLRETGLAPQRLELEITEGLLLADTEQSIAILGRLKALGVSLSMDDFGTGYSSLSYFRMFPFDKVKIDQSFVQTMESSPEALAIVRAVIGIAKGLGMPVVAEGVETSRQLEMLRFEGCSHAQGYLIGRPAPIEAFDRIVVDRGKCAIDAIVRKPLRSGARLRR